MLLKEQGLVDDVVWPARFEPGGCDRNKGWVEAWLASKVVLVRPARYFGAFDEEAAAPSRRRHGPLARARKAAAREVPDDLRQIRLRHGLSQAALADALGISPSYLSQVETGRIAASERLSGNASAYFAKIEATAAS
ncbi:MAG: helix-turn-helix transcriptional regulator [Rhodospirillales bacterium]|nr:helix-turn-helix transcriptional regulator [Rhodospirillales bacterium]